MTELSKRWLIDLLENEIKETVASIKNHKVWLKGCTGPSEIAMLEDNIQQLYNYHETLNNLQERIEESEINV
jgi:hypothetical protein